MNEITRRQRKNQLRREQRSKMRQDLIITEYIQLKYHDIYTETTEFYNSINRKYPAKYDLRKTDEFKLMKADTTGERIEKPSHHPIEQVSEPRPATPDLREPPTPVRLRFERHTYEDALQLRIPLMSPKPKRPPVTTEIIEEGTIQTPPVTTEIIEEGTIQTPSVTTEIIEEGTIQTPPVTTEIIEEGTIQTPPVTTEIIEEGTIQTPPVTTEILPMLTDEILKEDTIQPSLYDELDPQLIQRIIDDLRGEPCLQDIFTNIEQQVEFEELGMDIDLDILEDYTLEKEFDLM